MSKTVKTEKGKKIVAVFTLMQVADKALEDARTLLAEFGTKIPVLPKEAIKMMADATNSIELSNQFIRSFISVSVLREIVKVKPQETKEK